MWQYAYDLRLSLSLCHISLVGCWEKHPRLISIYPNQQNSVFDPAQNLINILKMSKNGILTKFRF